MRRGQVDDRVVYVERPLKLSVGCFVLAALSLSVPTFYDGMDRQEVLPGAIGYAVCFLVAAMFLQFRRRSFIIDFSRGRMLQVESQFLRPRSTREIPLADVKVVTTSALHSSLFTEGNRLYWIWLESPAHPRILFAGNLKRQEDVRDLVSRLCEDLRIAAAPLD